MPTFGRDSIRKFSNNVSELKRLGARDYENILQVSVSFNDAEMIVDVLPSAQFRPLMAYSLSPTIRGF